MKQTLKFRTAKYVLIIPAFVSAMIGMVGCFISLPIFWIFNPSYVLPDDKAGMEVAPVTSWFWRRAEAYTQKYWIKPFQEKYIPKEITYEKTD